MIPGEALLKILIDLEFNCGIEMHEAEMMPAFIR